MNIRSFFSRLVSRFGKKVSDETAPVRSGTISRPAWACRTIPIFCLLFPGSCFVRGEEAKPTESPNVIVVFIDDMGYADIEPFGGKIPTPNLDRMANEGRCFTNFIVPSATCSASRAALMTGCYPRRVGIPSVLSPWAEIGLHPDEKTIADICKQKGYATACFGKWHLGSLTEFLPTNRGFDEYLGLPYSNDMWPWALDAKTYTWTRRKNAAAPPLCLIEGTTIVEEVTPDVQKTLTKQYTDRAVRFIETNKDRPFFLYVPHSMVHVPLFVGEEFDGKSGLGLFADIVMEVDWSVGRILDTVRRLGLEENTLVVFTADNGPWLSYGNHAGSAYPLRAGKGTSFEGGIREPTVFWWPKTVPAGTKCDRLASTIDLLPTIAHLIDTDLPPNPIDGKDIRPLLFAEPDAESPHEAYAVYFNDRLEAVRGDRWKLVLPHSYRSLEGQEIGRDGRPGKYKQKLVGQALYDLHRDIGETTDCSHLYPEIVKQLSEAARKIRDDLGEGKKLGSGVRPPGQKKVE